MKKKQVSSLWTEIKSTKLTKYTQSNQWTNERIIVHVPDLCIRRVKHIETNSTHWNCTMLSISFCVQSFHSTNNCPIIGFPIFEWISPSIVLDIGKFRLVSQRIENSHHITWISFESAKSISNRLLDLLIFCKPNHVSMIKCVYRQRVSCYSVTRWMGTATKMNTPCTVYTRHH